MSTRVTAGTIAAVVLVLPVGSAFAHHSVPTNYFNYDDNPLVLVGTVKAFEVRNPHSLITVDVVETDGSVTECLVEWSDGNSLRRRGVNIDRVTVGDEVTIHARKHRRVENVAYVRDVVVADGAVVQDCGAGIYRGNEYYATCDDAEAAEAVVEDLSVW